MTELNFRIAVVPSVFLEEEQENILMRVKEAVQRCDLEVTSIGCFQEKKAQDEDYLEPKELVFQVQAKAGSSYTKYKDLQYKDFCNRWNCPDFYTYIVLHVNESFMKCIKFKHIVMYDNISFGVLPHDGTFRQYASPKPDIGVVHFYHDCGVVLIKYNRLKLSFYYDDIKSIFINITKRPNEIFISLPKRFSEKYSRFSFQQFHAEDFCRKNFQNFVYKTCYDKKHRNFRNPSQYFSEWAMDISRRANVLYLCIPNSQAAEEVVASIHYQCRIPIYYSNIETIPILKPSDSVKGDTHFRCMLPYW